MLGAYDRAVIDCSSKPVSNATLEAIGDSVIGTLSPSEQVEYCRHIESRRNLLRDYYRFLNLRRAKASYNTYVLTQKIGPLQKKPIRNGAVSLLYWLETNRRSEATDPTDKIYAVLGIVEYLNMQYDNSGYDPKYWITDYTATIEHIYSSTVQAIVHATGRLGVLGCCSPSKLVTQSWVPNCPGPNGHERVFS